MIILLLFTCDHYHFYELRDKVKSSAYFVASMLQQIKNTETDKQLTSSDIGRIAFASCLNFFHANSMFDPWPLGVFYSFDFFWVKRINSNNYQWQHGCGTTEIPGSYSPNTMLKAVDKNISTKTPSQIMTATMCADLLCDKDGEEKVLILCCYRKTSTSSKQKLGFFILEPQLAKGMASTSAFFYHQLVITPKPGLFPAKND